MQEKDWDKNHLRESTKVSVCGEKQEGLSRRPAKMEQKDRNCVLYSETLEDYVFRLNHMKLPTLTRNF